MLASTAAGAAASSSLGPSPSGTQGKFDTTSLSPEGAGSGQPRLSTSAATAAPVTKAINIDPRMRLRIVRPPAPIPGEIRGGEQPVSAVARF